MTDKLEFTKEQLEEMGAGEAELPPWAGPQLTPFSEVQLPDFPIDALPNLLRIYVIHLAEFTQTPQDMAAILSLGVIGTICGRRIKIVIRIGWEEPLNLYVLVALESGNRKSAVFANMTLPLTQWEMEKSREMKSEIDRAQNAHKILVARLKHLQGQAAKKRGDEALRDEAEAVSMELSELQIPSPPRLIVDDCTPEKLSTLLSENGMRTGVMSSEGEIFEIMAGRYSQKATPNFGIFLKGHSGDDCRVDRVNRPPEFLHRPALSLALTVQPEVIRGLGFQRGFRGKGLLARLLISLPESRLGHRKVDPTPIPPNVQEEYEILINSLLDYTNFEINEDTESKEIPDEKVLKLSESANERLLLFQQEVETQLATDSRLSGIKDWASKLPGQVARIAGLLHVAQWSRETEPWRMPVETPTLEAAIRIGRYLIEHALAAFDLMGTDHVLAHARHIASWLERQGKYVISRREIHQAHRSGLKTIHQLLPVLELLFDHGHLQPVTAKSNDPGRPSDMYLVNPDLLNTQNEVEMADFEDIEDIEYEQRFDKENSQTQVHEEIPDPSDGDYEEEVL